MRQPLCSHSLTKTFSDICIKAGGGNGVDYYLKYIALTKGSCEEERSFALERLLVKYPEIVLKRIGNNEELLDMVVWGFVNNRNYGVNDPYGNEDYKAMTINENGAKPILNVENCKSIFYQTNPILQKKYREYQYQIDYILNSVMESLENGKE